MLKFSSGIYSNSFITAGAPGTGGEIVAGSKVSYTSTQTSGTKIGTLVIDGTSHILYAPVSSGDTGTSSNLGSAGSATQPVYFVNGQPVECTHSLGAPVPADAVFTDKHVATTSSTGVKFYLLGASHTTSKQQTTVANEDIYIDTDNSLVIPKLKIGNCTITCDNEALHFTSGLYSDSFITAGAQNTTSNAIEELNQRITALENKINNL